MDDDAAADMPVPTITPNTTSAPAAAPSTASDSAKQLASFARADRAIEQPRQIVGQRLADQPRRVRVLDQAGRRRNRARNADADRAALAQLVLDAAHQLGDRAASVPA